MKVRRVVWFTAPLLVVVLTLVLLVKHHFSHGVPLAPPALQGPPGHRILKFPTHFSVGGLYVRDWGSTSTWLPLDPRRRSPTAARGKVAVPAGKVVMLDVPDMWNPTPESMWHRVLRRVGLDVRPRAAASPKNLSALADLGPFDLHTLAIEGVPLHDDDLVCLSGLTGLRELRLDTCGITGRALVHLNGLKSLERLILRGVRNVDAGIEYLKGLTSLKSIWLYEIGVGDTGLGHLKGMPWLEELMFNAGNVSDDGLLGIERMASLKRLRLASYRITDAGLDSVASLRSLEELTLENASVTDSGLAHLERLRTLRKLALYHARITNAGLRHIAALSSLEELTLQCGNIGDTGLGHLKEMTGLRKLDLRQTRTTGAGLVHLQELPSLQELAIPSRAALEGLVPLTKLTSLRVLSLGAGISKPDMPAGDRIDREEVRELRNALPHCTIRTLDNAAFSP